MPKAYPTCSYFEKLYITIILRKRKKVKKKKKKFIARSPIHLVLLMLHS